MWKHFCATEASWISVDDGQRCNWCNKATSQKTGDVRPVANRASDGKSSERPCSGVDRRKERG